MFADVAAAVGALAMVARRVRAGRRGRRRRRAPTPHVERARSSPRSRRGSDGAVGCDARRLHLRADRRRRAERLAATPDPLARTGRPIRFAIATRRRRSARPRRPARRGDGGRSRVGPSTSAPRGRCRRAARWPPLISRWPPGRSTGWRCGRVPALAELRRRAAHARPGRRRADSRPTPWLVAAGGALRRPGAADRARRAASRRRSWPSRNRPPASVKSFAWSTRAVTAPLRARVTAPGEVEVVQ